MESCINEPSDHRAVLIRLTVLFAQCKQYNIWMSILTCHFDTANTVIQWQHHTVQPNNENSFVGSLHSPLQVHSPSTWLCARGGCPVRMVPAAPLPSGYWLGLPNETPAGDCRRAETGWGIYPLDPPCQSPWAGCGTRPMEGHSSCHEDASAEPFLFRVHDSSTPCPFRPGDDDGWLLETGVLQHPGSP